MAHTNITTRIMQSRIKGLTEENTALKHKNRELEARLTALLYNTGYLPNATRTTEPDYSLGGHEFVDPTNGTDTWHS
jgi:hypothetical protein